WLLAQLELSSFPTRRSPDLPALSVLQDRGFRVALVTDGRMSGASGKTPAAIHLSPEALAGGPLAKVRDGDVIRLDPDAGALTVRSEEHTSELQSRENVVCRL